MRSLRWNRDTDDIDFPIASPNRLSCTEATQVQPETPDSPAHDASTRLLRRPGPAPETSWAEARPPVRRKGGAPVTDDSAPGKPHAHVTDPVTRRRSGRHRAGARGIDPAAPLWTDGDRHIPRDYRLYDHAGDGPARNGRLRATLHAAHARGLDPDCVPFDGRYGAPGDLELIRGPGWRRLTRLRVNSRVDLDRRGGNGVGETAIAPGGTAARPGGHGPIRVSGIVPRDGGTGRRATDDPAMDELTRPGPAERTWAIEGCQRGLAVLRRGAMPGEGRSGPARPRGAGDPGPALLRLERHLHAAGVSWYEAAGARIARVAVRAYVADTPHGSA